MIWEIPAEAILFGLHSRPEAGPNGKFWVYMIVDWEWKLLVLVVAFLPGLGVGLALRRLVAKHLRHPLVWLVPILVLFALAILGGVYWILYYNNPASAHYHGSDFDDRLLHVFEYIIYFLGWPSFYLGLGLSITFGFWPRHIPGLSLLALATASFGSGLALAIRYPDAMSAPAFGIVLLILSAVPLTVVGGFLSVLPYSRRLALVTALAAFMLSLPAIGLPAAAFTFR